MSIVYSSILFSRPVTVARLPWSGLLFDFVLTFKIKLDLDIVGIAKENLPAGTIWQLVHVIGDSVVGKMLLCCLEAAAAESDMIDDT